MIVGVDLNAEKFNNYVLISPSFGFKQMSVPNSFAILNFSAFKSTPTIILAPIVLQA